MRRVRIRAVAAGAAIALAASLVAACGSNSDTGAGGDQTTTTTSDNPTTTSEASEDTTPTSSEAGGESNATTPSSEVGTSTSTTAGSQESSGGVDLSKDTKKDLTIPIAAGWDEDVAVSHLWKYVLEKKGYNVELQTLDVGPVFVGVAGGSFDIFFDTWLPNTHKDYWKQYGDQVEDIGVWYDKAPLTIAVPDYMDIDSLEDLKSIGDKVDKTIIGIDPGAGLTRVTKEDMMPAYGLDDWTLQTSSTPAMLASLKASIDKKEPIVVTLWRPHWAYSAFPIKDLKDPKGAMGEPDEIHVIGSKEFADADPGLVAALKNFHMDDESLGSLEALTVRDPDASDAQIQAGVEKWVSENQDFVDKLFG
jgi:glycine betaine/proline transport system substrate-binding protein